MLQTLSPQTSSLYEGREPSLDLRHLLAIFRRRVFYFAIPFVLVLLLGSFVVAIQHPLYESEGEVLVESPQIPTDLVKPTVTATATERIEVIQQRIMTRDNLMSIVNKFGLFASERNWMSGSQLLDLMRKRAAIELVDINTALSTKDGKPAAQPYVPPNKNTAIAFTMSFEYENPELAEKVANEFLTLILNEDVRSRTSHATETTQFLGREVSRIQGLLDTVNAKISELKRQPDATSQDQEQLKSQLDRLAKLKADLIQAMSVYSDAHPVVKSLKRRIAGLEKQIYHAPNAKRTSPSPDPAARNPSAVPAPPVSPTDVSLDVLENRQTALEKDLDDARQKLNTARLGESMEREQQAEHLSVIEQPTLPQKPIKPNKPKLFAIAFAGAIFVSFGVLVAAEMLDQTIRGSRDLVGLVDSHLVIAIPYISTPGEIRGKKRKFILLWMSLGLILLGALGAALYIGVDIDSLGFDGSWTYFLTRLSK